MPKTFKDKVSVIFEDLIDYVKEVDIVDRINSWWSGIAVPISKVTNLQDELDSKGVNLTASHTNQKIYLIDANGNQIASLDVAFLNNEGTVIKFNETTKQIELWNDQDELLSAFDVADLLTNVADNINLTGSTLQLRDVENSVLSSVNFTINNIQGLQDALDDKANDSDLSNHIDDTNNPHEVTYSQLPDTPPNLSQGQIKGQGSTTFGLVSGQRYKQGFDKWIEQWIKDHPRYIRNILLKSDDFSVLSTDTSTYTYTKIDDKYTNIKTEGGTGVLKVYRRLYNNLTNYIGQDISMTFWIRNNTDKEIYLFFNNLGRNTIIDPNEERLVYPGVQTVSNSATPQIQFRSETPEDNLDFDISPIMIVEGDTPVYDWYPAPEDLVGDMLQNDSDAFDYIKNKDTWLDNQGLAKTSDLGDLATKDTITTSDIDNKAVDSSKLADTVNSDISKGVDAFNNIVSSGRASNINNEREIDILTDDSTIGISNNELTVLDSPKLDGEDGSYYKQDLDNVTEEGNTTTRKIKGSSVFTNPDDVDFIQWGILKQAGWGLSWDNNNYKLNLKDNDDNTIATVDLSSLNIGNLQITIDDSDPNNVEIVFSQGGVEVGRIAASDLLAGVAKSASLNGTTIVFKDVNGDTAYDVDIANILNGYQEQLTAGSNITINASNVISATDTTYTGTSGVKLDGTTFKADTDDTTIEVNSSNKLRVKDSGITSSKLAQSINNDIAKGVDAYDNKLNAGKAITINSNNDIDANVDGVTIDVVSDKLGVIDSPKLDGNEASYFAKDSDLQSHKNSNDNPHNVEYNQLADKPDVSDDIDLDDSDTIASSKAVKNLNDKVDDIEIGGRNYILDSSTEVVNSTTPKIFELTEDLDKDETYVLSYIPVDEDQADPNRHLIKSYSQSGEDINFTNSTFTFGKRTEIILSGFSQDIKYISIYSSNSTSNSQGRLIRIVKPKLEKGNKATDWTPAPEDIYKRINDHIDDENNPHNITKDQIGLGNVDNTSDTNKPISTATQDALNDKVDKVSGKQLSDENFTSAEKQKLSNLTNETFTQDSPTISFQGDGTENNKLISEVNISDDSSNTIEEKNDGLFVGQFLEIVDLDNAPNPNAVRVKEFNHMNLTYGIGAIDLSTQISNRVAKIDNFSFQVGVGTLASGRGSASFGQETEAGGNNSASFGFKTQASGNYSASFGDKTQASGYSSTSFGRETTSSGNYSVSLGYNTESNEFASMSIGRYPTTGIVETTWNEGSPIFKVGNGTDLTSRKNAYTLYNDGRSEQEKDFEVTTIGQGIVLKSPDGNRWRITVENDGSLTTTQL